MWKSKQSSYLEGPEVGGSNSRSGLSDFRQIVFNHVSLCFCFHKMEVRSSQLPQYADHKNPGTPSSSVVLMGEGSMGHPPCSSIFLSDSKDW